MAKLPKEIKLSPHARQRLLERKDSDKKYYMYNIMRSSVKWYGKDDLIHDCALYRHCCYTTRKSSQIGYITDGDIEIIYNKGTHVAITVLEVKDKFKPISQFIKPELLEKIKKEKKMKTESKPEISFRIPTTDILICPDCGKEVEKLNTKGICEKCKRRKTNMKYKGQEYIPYIELSDEEKQIIDNMQKAHANIKRKKKVEVTEETEPELTVPNNEGYYVSKANQTEVEVHPMMKPTKKVVDPLLNQNKFINTLRECGCEIQQEELENILNILVNTDKLKTIFMNIAKEDSQQAMLDLDNALNVIERKLQHNWEYNGFQEEDDIKFKEFLTWRRILKGAIYFWKKLYSSNVIIEMQKAWNAYVADPNEKITLVGDKMESQMKRFQITTESISTIYNTKRPFTRVFYAINKETAYENFKKWMSERQLHENPDKTTIVELKNEGERVSAKIN